MLNFIVIFVFEVVFNVLSCRFYYEIKCPVDWALNIQQLSCPSPPIPLSHPTFSFALILHKTTGCCKVAGFPPPPPHPQLFLSLTWAPSQSHCWIPGCCKRASWILYPPSHPSSSSSIFAWPHAEHTHTHTICVIDLCQKDVQYLFTAAKISLANCLTNHNRVVGSSKLSKHTTVAIKVHVHPCTHTHMCIP